MSTVGEELCGYITDTLNDIIIKTGQIKKDNKEIWDGFLHQLTNDDWSAMFEAFKQKVNDENIALRPDQQDKFERAYTTFQRDSKLRERCMDVRYKHKNTKDLAWAMIMTIREIWNKSNGRDIPNVDKPPPPTTPRQIKNYRREINITIQEKLFEF